MSTVSPDDVTPGGYSTDYTNLSNIVDVCILILTILGAGGVIVAILVKEYAAGRGSTIRSRLVLFLVFGDLMLGIIGIIPAIATLSGHPPTMGTDFCDADGFLLASALWAQHFNTLSLAVATYLILIHPLSSWTALVERRWPWSLPLVWIISFVMSAVAWAAQGTWGYSQGLCFYQPGLFGVIYQFIPRGVVFTTITILYFRLFVFLRRPDKIRSSTSLQGRNTSETETNGLDSTGSRIRRHTIAVVRSVRGSFAIPQRSASVGEASVGRTSRISEGDETSVMSGAMRKLSNAGADLDEPLGGPKDTGKKPPRSRSTGGADTADIPQWERLELPTFEGSGIEGPSAAAPTPSGWTWGLKKGGGGVFGGAGEGAGSKGMGGNPTPNLSLLKPPLPPPPAQPSLKRQSSFGVLGSTRLDGDGASALRRNSDTPAYLHNQHLNLKDVGEEGEPVHNPARRGSRVSFVDSPSCQLSASTPIRHSPPLATELPSHTLPSAFQFPPTSTFNTASPSSLAPYTFGSPPTHFPSAPPSPIRESFPSNSYPLTTFQSTFGGTQPPPVVADLTYLPQEVSPRSEAANPFHANLSYNNTHSQSTRRSSEATGKSAGSSPFFSRTTKDPLEHDRTTDETMLDEEDDEDAEWSLERILEMTQPPTSGTEGQLWEPREAEAEEAATGSDGGNFESTAKFMNRKASLLMLSFPLAYIVLFSVSLIRIIYDFSSNTPQPILIAVSRWFVFSQGLADALIYGLIEWKVKRTVRRRNKSAGRHASATGSATHASRQPSTSVGMTSQIPQSSQQQPPI